VYGAYNAPTKDTEVSAQPYLSTQADTSVSPFLATAFRNKPDMADKPTSTIKQPEQPKIKAIGGGGIKGGVSTIKPIAPTAVKPISVKPTPAALTGTASPTQGLAVSRYSPLMIKK